MIYVCTLTLLLESLDAYLPRRISNAIRNIYAMANFIDDISAFSKIIGNAKANIACCSKCGLSKLNLKWTNNKRYFWAIDLQCISCSNKCWSVCILCSSGHAQLSDYSLEWHNKSKHSNVTIDPDEQANVLDYGIDTENISANLLASEDLPDIDNFSKGHFLTNDRGIMEFENECSNTFFHHDFTSEMPGGGATALMKRS